MKFITRIRASRALRATALTAAAVCALCPTGANAQIPVTDIALNLMQGFSYVEQLLQYASELDSDIQLVQGYVLQLHNLEQLPGSIRAEVKNGLTLQLVGNVADFGVSYLGQMAMNDPDVSTFYANADNQFRTAYNTTPRTLTALAPSLTALGIPADMTSSIYKGAYHDRMTYERLLDDFRLVAMSRKNSETRATQANTITGQMQALGDNNTVGAIQLLAGQNSLQYQQQEDLLKTQAQTLKVLQSKDAEALAGQDDYRQHELDRLAAVQARSLPTSGTVPSF